MRDDIAADALRDAVERLLDRRASKEALALAATALHECLRAPVERLLAGTGREPTRLPYGVAIAPLEAAACLLDPVRTAMFLRAVDEALRVLLARFPGETIGVVYAGTGPLAPLLLPLLPRFGAAPIAVTFIDLHDEAIESVRTLAGSLGDSSMTLEFVRADACTYVYPAGRRLHLVVTETMQRALTREPQVAITRHLAGQLVAGGLFVPESVRVDLVIGMIRESDAGGVSSPAIFRDNRFVATLLDLRAGTASLPVDDDGCLPPVLVAIPPGVPSSGAVALYRTRIITFGDHRIDDDESGLTHPELASDVGPLEPGCRFEFRYRIGRQPGFVWRRLEWPEE